MDVLEKAASLGIQASFIDAVGHHRTASEDAIASMVDVLPGRSQLRIFSASVILCSSVEPVELFAGDVRFPIEWVIIYENGGQRLQGTSYDRSLIFQDLEHGVYLIRAKDALESEEKVTLISAPERAFRGNFDRTWILAVQLYGVRSRRNWGIGDFSDLNSLIAWAAQNGAGGIGLNPLHALFDDRPRDCSPYSPNSRLFLNPLYLDVERIAECPDSFTTEHSDQIDQLRSAEYVDYERVAALKLDALRQSFRAFIAEPVPERKASFESYRRREGLRLSRFACFEVLRRKYQGPWWTWPDGWSSPDDSRLNSLRNGPDEADIAFVEFVQWNADQQLSESQDLAARLGLPIGLYLDIAVGVKADGFDAWNDQIAISRQLSVGAPPDILNTAGQNWGLAGFNAAGLEACSFRPFGEMLNASMRYAGAVRLDHVLGLQRLYLIPEGFLPHQGAYVAMPFEALLSVAALASTRNKCVVIGEDLGTVPDGFRERLADRGLWSYRVMMFERGHDGSFHAPEHYPEDALVTFNTHDLPTFQGWSAGYDIALKQSLGIDPGEDRDARKQALDFLMAAFDRARLSGTDFYAAVSYLARARSRILALSIEDLLQVQEQVNIPGTIDQHPNWRRRLPLDIEEWGRLIDTDMLRDATRERRRQGD